MTALGPLEGLVVVDEVSGVSRDRMQYLDIGRDRVYALRTHLRYTRT